MPSPQQENLRDMISSVLEDFPKYEAGRAKRSVNDHLRAIVARRSWSGLLKSGALSIPASYTTGTVDVTLDSRAVVGNSTSWAVTDKVNTTLSNAVAEIGMVEVTPAAMTNIEPGVWLLIDGGGADEEAVFVIATTPTTFTARFIKTHAAAQTVKRSSLAGRQFRTGASVPFSTVTGVSSSTRLILDSLYPGATAATQAYSIVTMLVSFGRDVKQLWTVANPSERRRIRTNIPRSYVDLHDPSRDTTQSTFFALFHSHDLGGAPQWELYPRPTSVQVFPYTYFCEWNPLDGDLDILPGGIRSDVIVKRVKADAARWPGHKIVEGGIYFDPKLAKELMIESEADIQRMIIDDDNTHIMTMFQDWPYHEYGDTWLQSHDIYGY